ncbi:MAG TPA: hypothetical protein VKF61_00085 [Candidatus Polarisedimenticolia bacterium]|nr:hypothetical protein [Candidatus Polarisedimenticolia bacterium]
MTIQLRVLEVALRICRDRGEWTFGPKEIVAALADLNPGSVRTHVMSRCCVNAPEHHAHRWPYFRRLRRGVYEILPACRRRRGAAPESPDPVIAAYVKDIDRTLIRQNLEKGFEERLQTLQAWTNDMEELRGAVYRRRRPRRAT